MSRKSFTERILSQEWGYISPRTSKKLAITIMLFLVVFFALGLVLGWLFYVNPVIITIPYQLPTTGPAQKEFSATLLEAAPEGKYAVYIQLTNVHQNNRDSYEDYSSRQLSALSLTDTGGCHYNKAYQNQVIYPCGQISNSCLLDKIHSVTIASDAVSLNEANVIDKRLLNKFRGQRLSHYQNHGGLDTNNVTDTNDRLAPESGKLPYPSEQQFVSWFRASPTSVVTKLVGVLEVKKKYKQGDEVKLIVTSLFPAEAIGGTKSVLIVSTRSMIGPVAFVSLMAVSFAMSVIYMVLKSVSYRKMMETKVKARKGMDMERKREFY